MKRLLNHALAVLVFTALFSVSSAQAAWIDDWIQQKTTTNADYLEGQKRGFATFGGFSARWSTGNDYLVSVTPPQFKAGCGGIDVFLGGFSFLNADYLVQKLQNMLSAAPAVAFDLALNTLCEQCSKTIKSLEAASSRLNQLQFDDCKATRAGVSVLLSDAFSKNQTLAERKSEYVTDFLQSTGAVDMWQDIKKLWPSAGDKTPAGVAGAAGVSNALSQMVSGCPAAITSVFFSTGSLLDHLAALRGYDLSYTDLMRAYVGDVDISWSSNDYQYRLVPGCPQNTPEKIDGLVEGDVYERQTPAGACTQVTTITIGGSTYPSVRAWIFSMLNNACSKMVSGTALTTAEEDFLSTVPMPVYQALKADIQAQGPGVSCSSIADLYADSVAAGYAYTMITDFYDMIKKGIQAAETLAANQQGPQNPSDKDHCRLDLAAKGLVHLKEIKGILPRYIQAAREQYTIKLSGLVSHKEYAAKVEEFNNLVRTTLSRHFDRSLSHRVVRP